MSNLLKNKPRKSGLRTLLREPCQGCRVLPWNNGLYKRCVCHGFNLDVGSGHHKQPGFLGMDRRSLPEVDFVWNIENLPWPFPDDSVDRMLLSHILEHVSPSKTIGVFDEMWRVTKAEGQAMIVVPHGQSYGMLQDPTHQNFFVEATFSYFSPLDPSGLYGIYEPKPWKIERLTSSPLHNIEVILSVLKGQNGRSVENRNKG